MKKILCIFMILLAFQSYSQEKNIFYPCNNLEKDRIKLKKYSLEAEDLVTKAFNRPNKKRINKAFQTLKDTEEIINHITDDHYREIKEKDMETLFQTKLELYKIKNELYLLRKTLVVDN